MRRYLTIMLLTVAAVVLYPSGSAGAWKCEFHPEQPDCTWLPNTTTTSTTTTTTVPETTTTTSTTTTVPAEVSENPPSITAPPQNAYVGKLEPEPKPIEFTG